MISGAVNTMSEPVPSTAWWRWNVGLWVGIGLLDATQNVFVMRSMGMHHNWGRLFVTLLVAWLPWALATPFVLRLGRRYPPARSTPISRWFAHLALLGAIVLVTASWIAGLEMAMNPWAIAGPMQFRVVADTRLYNGLLEWAFVYAAILAVGAIVESRERLFRQETETAKLGAQLSRAQLMALRHQLEPHFLFNALNAVAGLVREERNDAAVKTIAGLSDCLRRVLDESDRQQAPLGEEIQFLRKYLDIQRVRFADALQLSIEIPNELEAVEVPTLILQLLVENAIKHGIARRVQGGVIRIAAHRLDGVLTLSVYNDGPPLPRSSEPAATGIGVANIRSRLRSLYGDAFRFELRDVDGASGPETRGVQASVSIPIAAG